MDDVQILTGGDLGRAECATYLLGDVLRIFSGDFVPGEIGGIKALDAGDLAGRSRHHARPDRHGRAVGVSRRVAASVGDHGRRSRPVRLQPHRAAGIPGRLRPVPDRRGTLDPRDRPSGPRGPGRPSDRPRAPPHLRCVVVDRAKAEPRRQRVELGVAWRRGTEP